MITVNISLPDQLKKEADKLVKQGYFASFSDFARTAIRLLLEKHQNEISKKK